MIYFTRRQACFSPFPHGTGSLSVTDEYVALEGGPPRFPRDSSCPAVLRYQCHSAGWCFVYRTLTLSRGAFQPTSTTLPATAGKPRTGPTTPESMPPGLGLSRFARRYSGNLG